MKIDVENMCYIVYLNKYKLSSFNFEKKDLIEKKFKKLFKKLKYFYGIDISGYYNIEIFIDKYYGAVLRIEKESIDYYDYFDSKDTVAMRIKKYNTNFLYQVEDYFFIKDIKDKFKIYKKDNNIYLKIINKLQDKDFYLLLEMSKLIYKSPSMLKELKIY